MLIHKSQLPGITRIFPEATFLYDYSFISRILEKMLKFVGEDWVIRVITPVQRKCTLASCINRAIMSLATNYRENISLVPISLFVFPFYRPSVTDFSIHDAKKEERKEAEVAPRRENIFMDINLFLPFFRDWKANAEKAFELWIGSQPTSILANSNPLHPLS